MANVMVGGTQTFDALAYGKRHPGTQNFFEQQLNTIGQFATNMLTEAGKTFFSNVEDLYEKFHGSEAMRVARAVARKVKSIWQTDDVRFINDIGDMQQAQFVMQRWIMANPVVRDLYHQQRCDGFSDTYIDAHPGAIGRDHYDYRRVMDGVLVEEGDDWVIRNYFDDIAEGDTELSLDEKIDILSTWEWIEHHISKGEEDPTSQYGASL